jgi:hypothetical protein
MCKFYWRFCFCCNMYKKTVRDSEWCGDVDCSRNDIITSYDGKMCSRCIEMCCYQHKKFCDLAILPGIIYNSKTFML